MQRSITGAGAGGGPHVRAFNGDGSPRATSFFAYPAGFTGGVRVAACDFDGDGRAEIVTGAGPGGGPHVRVFKLDAAGNPIGDLASFFAYAIGFSGGVFVACGDVNGDGKADIITGPDAGGGPHVRVFSGAALPALVELAGFFAYSPAFTGGVFVAAGNLTGDGRAEIVTGADAGGGPHVRVFTGTGADTGVGFFAYASSFTGGARVAAGNTDGGGFDEIVTAPGLGSGQHVRGFTASGTPTATSFFAY